MTWRAWLLAIVLGLGLVWGSVAAAAVGPVWPRPQGDVPLKLTYQWGRGVTFRAGPLFSLNLRARIQVQAFVSRPTDAAVAAGVPDGTTDGILVRRMRLVFAGHLFSPKLTYYIQLGFATRDLESDLLVPLRDAYATWQPLRDLGIRFGQMKVPFGRQRVVSSSALEMVDRSIVVAELSLDRDVGVYLFSDDFLGQKGRLKYAVGIFGGQGRNRPPGRDAVLYFGRFQVNPFGSFDDLSEGDFLRTSSPRLALAITAAQNINSRRALSTLGATFEEARFTYTHYAADLHFKIAGLAIMSEILYRKADKPFVDDEMGRRIWSRSAWGYFVQVGYMFPFPIDVTFRWSDLRPLGDTDPRLLLQHELGGGLGFYVWEHGLKLQTDYFYLSSENFAAGSHQWRLQAQLYF